MTMTVVRGQPAAQTQALSYTQTIDRTLVHRLALAEVFVTDARRLDEDHFVVAAQLPRAHPYYTDHLNGRLDPMLLLECCRQAETYAAHAFHDVPAATSFLLERWSLRLHADPRVDRRQPGELTVDVTCSAPRRRDGALRGLDYTMSLSLGGAPIGEVTMAVAYVPTATHRVLRLRQRGGVPVGPPAPAPRWAAAPHLVGRSDSANVVLADVGRDGAAVTAALLVPHGNTSILDHPVDHVPGMILTEAARQLAVLATNDRRGSATRTGMRRLDGRFFRYVELDRPALLRAVPLPDTGDEHAVPSTLEQHDRAVPPAPDQGIRGVRAAGDRNDRAAPGRERLVRVEVTQGGETAADLVIGLTVAGE